METTTYLPHIISSLGIEETIIPTILEKDISKEQNNNQTMNQDIAHKVEEKLEERLTPDEMNKQHEDIINPTGANSHLSSALAATAKELQKNITADIIDHHLKARPGPNELENHHVLEHSNVDPALQGVQKQLQKQINQDQLAHKLEKRPDVGTLEKTGVLDTSVAPAIAAAAKKLEKNLAQSQVAHLLEKRPSSDQLVKQHIVPEDIHGNVAPSLQGAMHDLERNITADTIAQKLRKRASISELEEKGIIQEGELGSDLIDTQTAQQASLNPREKYALALKAVASIAADGLITEDEKSKLKEAILSNDERVLDIVECYEQQRNTEDLVSSLCRLAKSI